MTVLIDKDGVAQATDRVMVTLEKNSGKGWFKQNEQLLRESVIAAISEIPAAEVGEISEQDQSELILLREQLSQTVEAHATLDTEYQATYKVLIDLATIAVGSGEVLRKMAPLTLDKLYAIIEGILTQKAQAALPADSRALVWGEARRKELVQIGHGPLAMGRFEGAKDTLVQLINFLRQQPTTAKQ